MARNGKPVRGPRSALTSFLEERGIRNANPAPGQSNQTSPAEPRESSASSESNVQTVEINVIDVTSPPDQEPAAVVESQVIAVSSSSSRGRRQPSRASKSASKTIQDDSSDEDLATAKKRALNKKKTAKKPKKVSDDSDDDEFRPDDNFGLNPKAHFTRQNSGGASSSGVSFCSMCRRRFVVTSETLKKDGQVTCSQCASDPLGFDRSLPAPKTKRQTKKRRRQNTLKADVDWFDSDALPSLQRLCIQVICNNIDAVESFGDISIKSMTQISRILSKHRRLDDTTLPLFLSQSANLLSLFDCARLCEDSLNKIAYFGRHLTELKLQFCGRMNDEMLTLLGKNLTNLNHFTLHGAFLVTENGYCSFFENVGSRLTYLALQHSPRFSSKSMTSLLIHCSGIMKLTISYCEKLSDESIRMLAKEVPGIEPDSKVKIPSLPNLETLDLSHPGPNTSDESLIEILPVIGSRITNLNLSGWRNLTDDGIICGIKDGCPNLSVLDVSHAEKLTSDGLRIFFEALTKKNLPGSGLTEVYMTGCSILIDDSVISSLLANHHRTLTNLSLNGLDGFTASAIETALVSFPPHRLAHLDVSWVRAISDPLLVKVFPLLPSLETLRVWGCHRVTETLILPKIRDRSFYNTVPLNISIFSLPLKVIGRECDTL